MSLTVKLYKNTSPAIKIGKTLSEEREVAGVLLQDVEDVAAPMVELSSAVIQPATGKCDWWSCNYAYIPALGRYYFITSKTIVDNDHYVLRLRTDVLYTWRTAITGTSAWISRSKSEGSWYLPDGMVPMESRVTITKDSTAGNPFLNPTTDPGSVNCPYVLAVAKGALFPGMTAASDVNFMYSTYDNVVYYALTKSALSAIMQDLVSGTGISSLMTGDPKSGVFSLHVLPFGVTTTGNYHHVFIGDHDTGINGDEIKNIYHTFTSTAVSIPGCDDFRNATGDYQIKVYLPMVGWTDIDPKIAKKRPYLQVKYKTNVLTGNGSCIVYLTPTSGSVADDEIYQMFSYNCAIQIPLTLSSAAEKQRSLITSALSSSIAIAGAVATENPLAIAGALGSAANTVGQNMMTPVRYSKSGVISGGDNYDVNPYKITCVYVLRNSPVLDNATAKTNFATCHGLRCDEMKTISSLSGFFKCANYWMDPPAGITEPELNEITSILESGAIV